MERLDGSKERADFMFGQPIREIGSSPAEIGINFSAWSETGPNQNPDLEKAIAAQANLSDFPREVIFVPAQWAEVKKLCKAGAYTAQAICCPDQELPPGTYKVIRVRDQQVAIVILDRAGHPIPT